MLLLKGCDSSLVSKFRAHLFHVVFQCMHLMPVCVHVYVCKTHLPMANSAGAELLCCELFFPSSENEHFWTVHVYVSVC